MRRRIWLGGVRRILLVSRHAHSLAFSAVSSAWRWRLVGFKGVFSIWVVGLPVVLALLICWMWCRIGVWWDGSVLVVRNRIRTVRIDGDEIVAFRARSIDFVPNFPDAIVVWHESDGRLRKTQILATAVIPVGSRIRWWCSIRA